MTAAHQDTADPDRLNNLEVKFSFMEDLVEKLNDVVSRQQEQIDLLTREVVRLRHEAASAEPSTFRSLRDELPPHY